MLGPVVTVSIGVILAHYVMCKKASCIAALWDSVLQFRVVMVLENPGKSWNCQKKIPGPRKSLNLGCGP